MSESCFMAGWSHKEYIERLKADCDAAYDIANEARSKGFDPKPTVEIPQAFDLADRTQKLLDFLEIRNTAEQIRDLTKVHDGNRELVALDISKIVTAESYLFGTKNKCNACGGSGQVTKRKRKIECEDCSGTGLQIGYNKEVQTSDWKKTLELFENSDKKITDKTFVAMCIYHGVCAGLAVLTEGILVAPLEGVVSCRILDNPDGSNALSISYAGPIRSAGGTGQALSVLIGDILRREFNLSVPIVSSEECERYKEEVSKYSRGLQYRPSNPQLEIIAYNCPVYIDGEGVGDEVSGQRDLPRVKTNKVREGMLLVMCEGLVLKAPKILKYTETLGFSEWDWLKQFIKKSSSKDSGIAPSDKYLSDVLAGRPIFGQPMKSGGFRLRYGRSRLAGLATTAIHPASMKVLGGFLIVGTQMKYERPGKATVVTPCDTIAGPYVEFKDGSGMEITDCDQLGDESPTDIDWNIEKIWDLGELLVPVGEFLENNHPLPPSPYVTEWYNQTLSLNQIEASADASFLEAKDLCKVYDVPMHPKYCARFSDVSASELHSLMKNTTVLEKSINVAYSYRNTIYKLGINIDKNGNIYGDKAEVLIDNLLNVKPSESSDSSSNRTSSGLDYINSIAPYLIKDTGSIRIGGRMGKPEGSKLREMKPPIHSLWPVGFNVGNQRFIKDAAAKEESADASDIDIGVRLDNNDEETIWGVVGGEETRFVGVKKIPLNTKKRLEDALELCEVRESSPKIKGVKGVTNGERMPENLTKGVLRYKNNITTFRDGTIRFDMVDITMTHFRPAEIGMSLEDAAELGYEVNKLTDICELKTQDVVLPMNCSEQLLRTTQYLDELLEKLYGLRPYYNCKTITDLIGHYAMGIAPHTSGAILCRIIGFADIKGHYGHPFFHAAKRRNCDGDIDAVLLLLDGLINFSKKFLPSRRGGQMDAPLILTTKIVPSEIDKEALNVDIGYNYPLEFYELTQSEIPPSAKEAVAAGVEIVENRLGSDTESENFGFTHDTTDCSAGPKNNPYNTLDSMRAKTMEQFALGEFLESVDNVDQSSRLINRHLIRDMRGNLRAYGQQKVRCPKCSAKYRRPPLTGKCNTIIDTKENPFSGEIEDIYCDGKIILTVTQGGVSKYDGLMSDLVARYGADNYTKGLYTQVSKWVKETFEDQNIKTQSKLWDE